MHIGAAVIAVLWTVWLGLYLTPQKKLKKLLTESNGECKVISKLRNEPKPKPKNKMTTEKNIKSAIARSVSHNEIVRCPVTTLTGGLRAVSEMADVEDSVEIDDMSSDKRLVDVWGKTWDGEAFRLYLFA